MSDLATIACFRRYTIGWTIDGHHQLPKYARAGWLAGPDPYFDETDIADPAVVQKGNDFEGTLYRWPLVADMGLLFWRTDLMKIQFKTS